MNLDTVDISKLPADVRKQFLRLQVMHAEKKIQNKAKNDFLSFVKCVWPEFVEGSHHRHIADKFNKLASGEINRLIINMPPRHTKSEFASYLLPAWMVGREPRLKIIQATHTGELAIRFGRKAKNLIDSEDYSKIFKTTLQEDSKAAGRWETSQGGEYFAAVLVVRSLDVVRTYLSLTTRTQSKMHYLLRQWSQRTSGIHQVLGNVYNQAVRSYSL